MIPEKKIKYYLFISLTAIALAACNKQDVSSCDNIATPSDFIIDSSKANVRIQNNTALNLCDFILDPGSMNPAPGENSKNYGNVFGGMLTKYIAYDTVYSTAWFSTDISGKQYINDVGSHAGDTALSEGFYTFIITYDGQNDAFVMNSKKDSI